MGEINKTKIKRELLEDIGKALKSFKLRLEKIEKDQERIINKLEQKERIKGADGAMKPGQKNYIAAFDQGQEKQQEELNNWINFFNRLHQPGVTNKEIGIKIKINGNQLSTKQRLEEIKAEIKRLFIKYNLLELSATTNNDKKKKENMS